MGSEAALHARIEKLEDRERELVRLLCQTSGTLSEVIGVAQSAVYAIKHPGTTFITEAADKYIRRGLLRLNDLHPVTIDPTTGLYVSRDVDETKLVEL